MSTRAQKKTGEQIKQFKRLLISIANNPRIPPHERLEIIEELKKVTDQQHHTMKNIVHYLAKGKPEDG